MDLANLKNLLANEEAAFWPELAARSLETEQFDELFALSVLRKKARAKGLPPCPTRAEPLRIALLGGYSLYPLCDLVEHLLAMRQIPCQLLLGDFDNYVAEIVDPAGKLYQFLPQVVILLPSASRCKYSGSLSDSREAQQAEAAGAARQVLDLSRTLHERARAEVVLANWVLPCAHDPGPLRGRTLGSDWNFRKWANLELGLNAPPYIHLCDLEFLAYRYGGLRARDDRAWFESRQPGSPELLVQLSRELAHLVASLRFPPKKVLALDLDGTLWGSIIAEDGL